MPAPAEEPAERHDGARPVPEDLVQWFAGESPRFDRYGLPRIEIRHRVLEALSVFEMLDEPHVVRVDRIREFKTKKAADACRDRLAKSTGHAVIYQAAVVLWMTEDELPRFRCGRPEEAM